MRRSMASPRFFLSPLTAGQATFEGDEAAHVAARRLRVGDVVTVFDGRGNEADGRVSGISRGRVTLTLGEARARPFDVDAELTLAVCVPKGHRPDALIEKCTELGVAAIWPMVTRHAAVRPGADRADRWRRIAVEAAKQSQRAWVPMIEPPAVIEQVVERRSEFDAAFVLEPQAARHLLTVLDEHRKVRRVLALIGPEGGFSDAEREMAAARHFVPAGLGPTVLRVETAAIAVATLVLGWAAARGGAGAPLLGPT
jgi:16S rRNA (uracil1498-N3)-methyltransferase